MNLPASAEPERSLPQSRAAIETELLRAALEFARRATGVLRLFPGGVGPGIMSGEDVGPRLDAFERRVLSRMEELMADVKADLATLGDEITKLGTAVSTYIANHPATTDDEEAEATAIQASVANLKAITDSLAPPAPAVATDPAAVPPPPA